MAFDSSSGDFRCSGVALGDIAHEVGTPVYVYDATLVREAYRALDRAFRSHPHHVHYALKANSTLALVRLLRDEGAGADANSGGEIEVALRAGLTPDRIVFTGVGKTPEELGRAIALGVRAINVESAGEVDRLEAAARAQGRRARLALRVNPDIDANSHPHISTGLRINKFGVGIDGAAALFRQVASRPHLHAVGVHVHIGSQILDLDPLARAARAVASLARQLSAEGLPLEHLDLGGGLGISYDGHQAPSPEAYAAAVLPAVREAGLPILLEPGRLLVGPAGVLVARVVDMKCAPGGPTFVVLDAGMTELLRPALYGAYHAIEPLEPRAGQAVPYSIVGPLCESSDSFGKDRLLPPLQVGDLVAIRDTGAYGFVMASNYNRRLMPAEVLIDAGGWRVIRRRQSIEDLTALED